MYIKKKTLYPVKILFVILIYHLMQKKRRQSICLNVLCSTRASCVSQEQAGYCLVAADSSPRSSLKASLSSPLPRSILHEYTQLENVS